VPAILVSIVIPHQAGAEILLACLQSVARDTSFSSYEIWVVDNGSSDGSVEIARQRFPGIQVLRFETNLGYAGGCNRIQTPGLPAAAAQRRHRAEPGCERGGGRVDALPACQLKIRCCARTRRVLVAGGLLTLRYPSRGRLMGTGKMIAAIRDRSRCSGPASACDPRGPGRDRRLRRGDVLIRGDRPVLAFHRWLEVATPTAIVYYIGGYC
jgi:glycosyltransferase involved in cell wall biosynthesis